MAKTKTGLDLKYQPGFKAAALFCLVLLYSPILILVLFSFNAGDLIMHWEGISAHWYGVAINNVDFFSAAKNTLIISVSATVIATTVATLAAVGMTRVKPWPGLAAAFMIVNMPLMVPEIITAVASLSFFALLAGTFGFNLGIGNLVLVHSVFCIPFAFMPIRARLQDMDVTLEQAAADLYASPALAFRKITLPLLTPGIVSGAALAFIVSFDDFTITQLVAGPGQTTLPLFIWDKLRKPMTPEINAISAILLMVSITFVVLSFLVAQRKQNT
jgi:spermidine/putrescine transport system permease protein